MDILCCPVCKGDLILTVDQENEKEILEGNAALRCHAMRTIRFRRASQTSCPRQIRNNQVLV